MAWCGLCKMSVRGLPGHCRLPTPYLARMAWVNMACVGPNTGRETSGLSMPLQVVTGCVVLTLIGLNSASTRLGLFAHTMMGKLDAFYRNGVVRGVEVTPRPFDWIGIVKHPAPFFLFGHI